MVSKTAPLTLDEFARLYEESGPFEIINGDFISMSPPLFGHAHLANLLARLISDFIRPEQIGEVFVETPFVLPETESANWVKGSRVPDVMYIQLERLTIYKNNSPDWKTQPLALVPDLVVEIISINDRYSDINAKVELYLKDGVQMIWILDPQRKTVTVHTHGSKQHITLSTDDILKADPVIPGFQVTISQLFE
jgi:Uma2 family endonuclease